MTTPTYWVPNLSPKQMELFNDAHRFLLATGPRKSGKTWAIMHKILRHCFDNNARVAMFTKTTRNAKAGGVWLDLTQIALPEWIKANIGMKVLEEPKVTGDTRMSYFKVSNRFGGESEVQLHSLEYCPEIVEKIKGGRFSMFYFSELDNFDDKIVFDISEDQLRMMNGTPFENHQWIGDTNPPDTGPNNWQHDFWFKEKDRENHTDPEYQDQIQRIEFKLDDNPFLDPREKRNLIAKYRHRPSLYNRFILGNWEEDLTDGCFSEVFRPEFHILGNIQKPQRKDWEIIVPTESCTELFIGLDPGDVNHAAHIVEQIHTPTQEPNYSVIDEIVSVGKNVSLKSYVQAIVSQMDFWEKFCMDKYKHKIRWRTWADSSVDRYRSAAASDEVLFIRNMSNGRIQPRAASKFTGSIETRVRILHRLLWENRLFVSASCPDTIAMIKALKYTGQKAEPIGPRRHKHPFDSLTYVLMMEEPAALEQAEPRTATGAAPALVLVG